MTRRQAGILAFGSTALFTLVFAGLTIDSHRRFPAITNSDSITVAVRDGQEAWHRRNCVNCHTLLGEGAYYAPDLTRIASQRGSAYLAQFLKDPTLFYSEERDRRIMTTFAYAPGEIENLIAFLHWIDRIDNGWPPRPILVSGGAPGAAVTSTAPASDDPVALGEALFRATPPGCATCHSTNPDVRLVGPSVAGIAARVRQILTTGGYRGAATDVPGYIRESIVQPSAYLVPGPAYAAAGKSVMPENFGSMLTPEQIEQLVAYLATLH